jgi:hypothetical protein
MRHVGGCLCDAVRFVATSNPLRITICHCRACQRSTGSAFLFQPMFSRGDFALTEGEPAVFRRRDACAPGADIHFCAVCGVKLFTTFEDQEEVVGVYGGAFDDPAWAAEFSDRTFHVNAEDVLPGVLVPAGVQVWRRAVKSMDGLLHPPVIFDAPYAAPARRF